MSSTLKHRAVPAGRYSEEKLESERNSKWRNPSVESIGESVLAFQVEKPPAFTRHYSLPSFLGFGRPVGSGVELADLSHLGSTGWMRNVKPRTFSLNLRGYWLLSLRTSCPMQREYSVHMCFVYKDGTFQHLSIVTEVQKPSPALFNTQCSSMAQPPGTWLSHWPVILSVVQGPVPTVHPEAFSSDFYSSLHLTA